MDEKSTENVNPLNTLPYASLLNDSASWIGLTDEIVDKLQVFQNKFTLRFFEAPKQGTPTSIVELDPNKMPMKDCVLVKKLILLENLNQTTCATGH